MAGNSRKVAPKPIPKPNVQPEPVVGVKGIGIEEPKEAVMSKEEILAKEKAVAKEKKDRQDAFLNERVPFMAMKDNDKYKDDIVVSVNGTTTQIQRGVKVMIPRKVLYAIEDAERQKMSAADVSQKFENKYKENVKTNMM